MLRQPVVQLGANPSQFVLDPLLVLFPRLFLTRQVGVSDAVLGIHPVLRIEGRKEDRLQPVVLVLSDRFELVVVTPRAVRG